MTCISRVCQTVAQQFLALAKVYREFYKAIVELRTEGTWPKAMEELGLFNIFEVRRRTTRGGTE